MVALPKKWEFMSPKAGSKTENNPCNLYFVNRQEIDAIELHLETHELGRGS